MKAPNEGTETEALQAIRNAVSKSQLRMAVMAGVMVVLAACGDPDSAQAGGNEEDTAKPVACDTTPYKEAKAAGDKKAMKAAANVYVVCKTAQAKAEGEAAKAEGEAAKEKAAKLTQEVIKGAEEETGVKAD